MKAIIHIGLKAGVLDPAGEAVSHTLARMGFEEVKTARIGKVIELDLDDLGEPESRSAAEARVKSMCERLLANTVIETYRFELVE